MRYLDLGAGNTSVLQMVSWYLLSYSSSPSKRDDGRGIGGSRAGLERGRHHYDRLEAVGVEARSEAVDLARRSLSFNLGNVASGGRAYESTNDDFPIEHDVRIVHGDFRDLVDMSSSDACAVGGAGPAAPHTSVVEGGLLLHGPSVMKSVAARRYDLITGTPPYFRVGFSSSSSSGKKRTSIDDETDVDGGDDATTISAVIQQGGMPTSMQSAPARCEFRGGIEAYCHAASAMLSHPHGIFVVCENWINDDRVRNGAEDAGLVIDCVWPIRGGVRKETNLFAVYVMRKNCGADGNDERREETCITLPAIAVRDVDGKWTHEYAKILEAMSIPVLEEDIAKPMIVE